MRNTASRCAGRGLLLSFVVGILALSLVVTTGQTARADTIIPPGALAVAETTAAPTEVEGGAGLLLGACATGVGCLATAAGIGIFAYATRDTWVPVVKGAFNALFNHSDTGPVNVYAMTATASGGVMTWRIDRLADSFGASGHLRYNYQCVVGSSVGAASSGGTFQAITYTQNQTNGAYTLCTAPATLANFQVWVVNDSEAQVSNKVSFGAAVPDGSVSQTSDMACNVPGGTTEHIIETYLGNADKVAVPSCQEHYPGSWPKSFDASAGWPGSEQPIVHHTFSTTTPTDYPDCFGSGGAYLNTCRVRVWINGAPCHVGVAICTNWQTAEQDDPSTDVKCQWGPYEVAMSNCTLLKNSYKTDAQVQTLTTADPTTGTAVDPAVAPPTGPTLPPTWVDTCWLTCTPPAICTDDTGPTCHPSTPPADSSCISAAFSWNPVDWVYIPVKCALRWAFVPPAGTFEAAMDRIKSPLASAFGPWDDAVAGPFEALSAGSGDCHGLPVTLPKMFTDAGMPATMYPFDACTGTSATIAGYCRLIATVLLTVFAVLKSLEMLQAGLGLSTHVKIIGNHEWSENVRGEKF